MNTYMPRERRFSSLLLTGSAALILAACATQPAGPTVSVMPGPNKPFEAFQQDETVCRNYAAGEVAGGSDEANNRVVGGTVIGAVIGTGLGAVIGGGRGAAVGAASGAVVGTAAGAGQADDSQYGMQRRYNISYMQCMYAKGNQVPGYTRISEAPPPPPYQPPPR